MKFSSGAWMPDDESDPVMLKVGAKYQRGKLLKAMNFVEGRRTALDIGAHCGFWSMQLKPLFEKVVAFEPLDRHIECLMRNVDVEHYKVVLGEKRGHCSIHVVEGLSGQSYVKDGEEIQIHTLDEYKFDDVDFIKIDCEGYETFVLKGAVETLKKNKPAIIVENKEAHKHRFTTESPIEFLQSLGAKVKMEIMGDYIMVWE